MRRGGLTAGCALLLVLAGCSASPSGAHGAGSASAPGTRASSPPAPSSSTRPRSTAPRSTPPPTTSTPARTTAPPPPAGATLPHGGRTILGRSRVVAYYGVAGNRQLGVLGSTSPELAADRISARAAGYRGYGRAVQPAMELIATVAQGAPGADHTYSKPIGADRIHAYLDVVHQHKMLLILDLQPGRASFLSQAEALRPFLLDPSVELALDPEWKVGPGQAPGGGRIGASSAAGINAVGRWLADLVRAHHLPDKLLVVHQFTSSMLPDRQHIQQHHGVEMVLHADGFGTVPAKINVLRKLAFPHPPFGVGFKLFLTQDARLMSPREVMALRPRPDVITYQ